MVLEIMALIRKNFTNVVEKVIDYHNRLYICSYNRNLNFQDIFVIIVVIMFYFMKVFVFIVVIISFLSRLHISGLNNRKN